MRLDFELFTSTPQSTAEKDFHRQPCFFLLHLLTFDLGLNLKQSKQGNEKKKEMMKQKMTGNRKAHRYLFATFISVRSLLLNSFSSFWRKQKSTINDVMSSMTQLQTKIDYMPDEHQVTAFK